MPSCWRAFEGCPGIGSMGWHLVLFPEHWPQRSQPQHRCELLINQLEQIQEFKEEELSKQVLKDLLEVSQDS